MLKDMSDASIRDWFLAVDLDGNLSKEDEEARSLLRGLRSSHGLRRAAIATAHPKCGKRVRGLGLYYEMDYLVLENGSVMLERDGASWRDAPRWLSSVSPMRGEIDALENEILRRTEIAGEQMVDYTDPPMKVRLLRLSSGGEPVRFEVCAASMQLVSKDAATFQAAIRLTREAIARLGLKLVEVMDATSVTYGCGTKGSGVAFAARLNGVALFTVAMGDSINDISMLTSCGLPCAPANALPEIKELVRSRGGIVAVAERVEAVKEVLRLLPGRLTHAI